MHAPLLPARRERIGRIVEVGRLATQLAAALPTPNAVHLPAELATAVDELFLAAAEVVRVAEEGVRFLDEARDVDGTP